jgi:uncharacterized protein
MIGLFCGIIFGFLLRKAHVSRFDTIVSQLMLKDFTVMKVILTAVVVGSVGIYSLQGVGLVPTLHLSGTPLLYGALGGAIFGVGMSVAGYCPGTAIAALGDGSWDMVAGIGGMFFGTILFGELIGPVPCVQASTLASLFSLSPWMVIAALCLVWAAFALGMRRLENRRRPISA